MKAVLREKEMFLLPIGLVVIFCLLTKMYMYLFCINMCVYIKIHTQ